MRSYYPRAGVLLALAAVQAGVILAQTPGSSPVTLQLREALPTEQTDVASSSGVADSSQRADGPSVSPGEAFVSDGAADPAVSRPSPSPPTWTGVRPVQFDVEIPPPAEDSAVPAPAMPRPVAPEPFRLPAPPDYYVVAENRAAANAAVSEEPPAPFVEEAEPVPSQPPDSSAAVSDTGVLTLLELEEMALASNPTLVQARMAIRAAQGRRLQAGLFLNPTIGYIGDEIGNSGRAGQHGMSLSQEFITAGKRRLGRAVAAHAVEEARWRWEVQRHRVINDVRIGYVDVALAQETVDINKEFVRIGQESVSRIQVSFEALQVAEIDLLRARNEAKRADMSLDEAEGIYRSTWRRLAIAVGQREMAPERLAIRLDIKTILGSVPELDQDASLARLLAESPELARARAGQQRARCEVARQYAGRTPNFQVSTGVKYDDSTGDAIADVGFSVPLPLFDRNQGRIMEARAESTRADRETLRIEMDLRDRLETAFEQYGNARRRVEDYHATILPNSQSLFEKSENAFQRQQISYLEVMTTQRSHFRNQLGYLISVRELLVRRVEIEGLLLTGGLRAAE